MYRIVDIARGLRDAEIAAYESAYDGLAALRRAVFGSDVDAGQWRLVAPDGAVLVESADLLDEAK